MKPNRKITFKRKLLYAAVASCFAITPAYANPIGASVVNGQVGFATQGSTLTITNTPNAIINWQQFSISPSEITRFVQQSASSAVLNRVLGQDPSQILGSLLSNGRVFLINPNGIVFGQGAVIDVAGLVASTLRLSDGDFLAGKLNFTNGVGAGGIDNQGTITAPNGGNIYLIAPDIKNSGLITSPQGEILLAAGHTVNLMDTANPNVQVTLSAPDTQAVNIGTLMAQSGKIGIYGALIDQQGVVNADAAVVGDGGKITLKATGNTLVSGTLSARGGQEGGNGGFIETSGAHVNIAGTAKIDTSAPKGKTGTWLIDPFDFTIAASGGDMTGATLSASLGGGNVTILSSSGAAGANGDIFVNDAVSWSANTLTLTAARNINLNAVMTASGTSVLSLDHEFFTGVLKVGIDASGAFMGRVDFPGRSGAGMLTIGAFPYFVINSLGSPGSLTAADLQGMNGNRSGFYALGSNINAASTSIWNGGLGFDPVGLGPTSLFSTFTGRFDGLGHTITGLTINRPATDYIGLFGFGNGARIRNVGVTGASVTGRDFVGGLVGYTNSGGSDKIANSYYTGAVTGFSTGNGSVGGLVGANYGSITDSYSTGTVTGVVLVGGLVGWNRVTGAINSSYSTAAVSGGPGSSAIGGLVGMNEGFVSNSYSIGNVSGIDSVGGLVGFSWNASITNSYSAGSVGGSTLIGGLVGQRTAGSIVSSYWDMQTSLQPTSAGGTGLTTAQMKTQASFSGWDFTNTWKIGEGVSYPTLRAFTMPAGPASLYWDNGAGDGLWSSILNWSTDMLPGAGGTVTIGSGYGTITYDIISLSLASLTASSSLDIQSGKALTLTNGGTFNAPVSLGGTLQLNGGPVAFNAPVSGAGTLGINGAVATAANSVTAGTLNLAAGSLSGAGALTVSNSFNQTTGTLGSSFASVNITQAAGDLTVGSMGATGAMNLTAAAGNITLTGAISAGGSLTLTAGNNINVSNGGNIYLGNNTLTLAANAGGLGVSGDVIIRQATVETLGNMNVSGRDFLVGEHGVYGNTTVTAGGTLSIGSPTLAMRDIKIFGGSASEGNANASVTATGDVNIYANSLTLEGGSAGCCSLTNAELTATNNINITLTGGLTVTGGTVNDNYDSAHALIQADRNVTIKADGAITLTGGTINSSYGNASARIVAANSGSGNLAISGNLNPTAGDMTLKGGNINSGSGSADAMVGFPSYNSGGLSLNVRSLSLTGGVVTNNFGYAHANAVIDGAEGAVIIKTDGAVALTGGAASWTGTYYGSTDASARILGGVSGGSITITGNNNAGVASLTLAGGNGNGSSARAAAELNAGSGALQVDVAGNLTMNAASDGVGIRGGDMTINVGGAMALSGGVKDASVYAYGAIMNITAVGNITLTGGSGSVAPEAYIASSYGTVQTIKAGGDLLLTGGTGPYARTFIAGNPDTHLDVGGVIRLQKGSGSSADAYIESSMPTSIFINFPNRYSGGYFVNGTELAITDGGNTGFFAYGLPAILNTNLHITYLTLPPVTGISDPVIAALDFGAGETNNAAAPPGLIETISLGNQGEDEENDKPVCK